MQGWTVHGGRLGDACRAYGGAAEDWLDLSTGINPHAWRGSDAIAVDWRALPDERALAGLETAAADVFGVAAAHVCALPGTEIGLRLIGGVLAELGVRGGAVHVVPAYRTHCEAIGGSRGIAVEAVDEAAAEGRTILIANPNNPDGRLLPAARIVALAGRLRGSGGWLIVDEAFADVRPEASVAGHVGDDLPLILFRSFGKFFGLAGVRLGFVIGPAAVIAGFRRRIGSWPVSAAAIAIGTAAYRDRAWAEAMRATLDAEAAALDAVLATHGYRATGDCPLFRLIATDDAAALFERLARQHILTRPFDHDGRWLRLGLPGGDAALARLDRALRRG